MVDILSDEWLVEFDGVLKSMYYQREPFPETLRGLWAEVAEVLRVKAEEREATRQLNKRLSEMGVIYGGKCEQDDKREAGAED